MILWRAATNFDASIFWHYLFFPAIIQGAEVTIVLAVLSQAAGIALGLIAALGRLSRITFAPFAALLLIPNAVRRALGKPPIELPHYTARQARAGGPRDVLLRILFWRWSVFGSISSFYIWLFRGTPLLVQIVFVYFAVPQMTGDRISIPEFWSAFIALGLNEGAYMAEIIRAGITSVETGQMEAAESLGMTRWLAMRRIILPQAIRFIIPPTGNEFISMLKNTSLAYAVSTQELFFETRQIMSATFYFFELLSVASVWYLAMTTVATFFQGILERRYERGFVREMRGPGLMERAWLGALRRG